MIKYYIIIGLVVFGIFIYNSIMFRKREIMKLRKKIHDLWGNPSSREYEVSEMKKISNYFEGLAIKYKNLLINRVILNTEMTTD